MSDEDGGQPAGEYTEQNGAIKWMSDGPRLKLANGQWIRPVLQSPYPDPEDYIPLSTSPIDKYSTYGPEVDEERVSLWFEGVNGDISDHDGGGR